MELRAGEIAITADSRNPGWVRISRGVGACLYVKPEDLPTMVALLKAAITVVSIDKGNV